MSVPECGRNLCRAPLWRDKLAAAEQRVARLEEALRKFGKHPKTCNMMLTGPRAAVNHKCDCGLDALLAEGK